MLTPWQRDLAMRKNVLLDNLFRNQFQAAAIKGTVFFVLFYFSSNIFYIWINNAYNLLIAPNC